MSFIKKLSLLCLGGVLFFASVTAHSAQAQIAGQSQETATEVTEATEATEATEVTETVEATEVTEATETVEVQADPPVEVQETEAATTDTATTDTATTDTATTDTATTDTATPAPARANIENYGALKAYVDGIVEGYMQRDNIAGATLSIVQDNKVIYSNGYGASHLDDFAAVSAENTLFRIGSISKTFIWTALMQLREAGKLNLNDPVNMHLPESLQLPDDDFENPILIRHLMNHNLGYEDSALGHLFVKDAVNLTPLREYLRKYRPEQVREAGVTTSYSNYGAAIAGVIVEEVSGQDFNSYVEEHIFNPLGMNSSSFREPYAPMAGMPAPIDPALAENISAGFAHKNGRLREQGFEFIEHIAPAGAMSATAEDMSRYMMAHLNLGGVKDQRILNEDTAKTMQEQSFSNTSGSNGFAHGMLEYSLPNHMRGIGHGGATLYFMSNMVLIPELNFGIFISTNTNTGYKLAYELPALFTQRFFAEQTQESTQTPPTDFAERGLRFTGTYLTDRHSYEGLEKITSMLMGFTNVGITSEGYLTTTGQLGTTSWVEVSPLHFQEVNGYKKLSFIEDEDGDITKMVNDFGVAAATKVGFLKSGAWFQLILPLTLLASLGSVIGAWLRRKRHINESLNESVASRLAAILGFVWLMFFIFFFTAIIKMAGMQELNVYSFPPSSMNIALTLGIIGFIITLINVPSFFVIWRDANWPFWRRIRHSLVIIFSILFVLTLYHWNLLGFHYF